MKAKIITLHTVCNYGTQLQALATQKKLLEYFDEVEFINFKRDDTYGHGLLKQFSKGNLIRLIAFFPTYIRWKKIFGSFQKEYLNIEKNEYLTEEDFEKYEDDADVYITGSDQVWNTGWNKGIIPAMYLNFIKNKPKFSYAASFGKKELENEHIIVSSDYIKDYNLISVREDSGLNILKNQYKYDKCTRILDPTLAYNGDFWRNLTSKKRLIKEKYILVYNLNNNKKFDEFANNVSKKTGLKLYRFCTRYDQILKNGKSLLIPNVLDFINLIDNAEYVITDSFHATAFSINLNTEPICIYPSDYSSRLDDFLKLVGASDKHVKNYNDYDVLNRKIDFEKVNKILDVERKHTNQFLSDMMKEVKKFYER